MDQHHPSDDDQPARQEAHDLAAQEEQFFVAWRQLQQQSLELSLRLAHQYGVSASQFNMLGLLEKMEGRAPCTIRWLSQQMSLDPATVVRAVDFLEARGLVARRRDTRDRRQVFVELTDQGRTLQTQLHQQAALRLSAVFRAMSYQGRAELIQSLHEFLALSVQIDQAEPP